MAVPLKIGLLDGSEGKPRNNKAYPSEKPTPRDISLCSGAIQSLTSASYHLPISLGSVSLLNPDIDWFWSSTESILVNCFRDENDSIQSYEHFVLPADVTITRQPRYIWQHRG